jgi:apolipoprotein N-acyltransferase
MRRANRIGWRAAAVCAVSGALAGACFYVPLAAFLMWILPAPALALIFAEGEKSGADSRWRTAKLAAIFVISFFFCSYLVGFTIDVYFPKPIMLLLDFALILVATLLQGVPQIIALCVGARLRMPIWARVIATALLWTVAEWLTTIGPFAFPVRVLAVSQWKFASLIKMSAIFGELFVSFMIMIVAGMFAVAIMRCGIKALGISSRDGQGKNIPCNDADNRSVIASARSARSNPWDGLSSGLLRRFASRNDQRENIPCKTKFLYSLPSVVLAIAIICVYTALGSIVTSYSGGNLEDAFEAKTTNSANIHEANNGAEKIRVIAVQHNQEITENDRVRFENAYAQAQELLEEYGADLLVLPESTAQFVRGDSQMRAKLSALAKNYNVDIIVGGANQVSDTESAVVNAPSSGEGSGLVNLGKAKKEGVTLENAVHLFTQGGEMQDYYYAKQQLVPFFENGNIQEFSFFSGDERGIFETSSGRIGAIVCFESVLQQTVRDTVKKGAEVIVVPSNDAYLGAEIREMHIAQSVFRAVETNRVIVQVATNGVTAAAYPSGKLVTVSINKQTALIAEVYPSDAITPYVKFGNLWLAVVAGMMVIYAVGYWIYRKKWNAITVGACE